MNVFGRYEVDEAESGRFLSCYRPPVPPLPVLEDVWDALQDAQRFVGEFDRALSSFPVPGAVGKLFARLDAVHSSGAEGATTTFTDLLEYQSLKIAEDPEDAGSVAGCADAFDMLQAGPLDLRPAILAIHRRLFETAHDPHVAAQAGQWKTRANCTSDYDSPNGFFYYTRPRSLPPALEEWEAFTLDGQGPELVRQSLSHWMFEHIHPVGDGNGRVGRLLVPLVLRRKGATANACCFLGEAVHRNKDLYIDALKRGRRIGDVAHWTRLLLSFAAQTAAANLDRLTRLGAILDRWRQETRGLRRHSVVHRMLPWVLTKPVFTVKDAMAEIGDGKTFATLNTAVATLADLGIVAKPEGSARDRLFMATDVLRLFEEAPGRRPALR